MENLKLSSMTYEEAHAQLSEVNTKEGVIAFYNAIVALIEHGDILRNDEVFVPSIISLVNFNHNSEVSHYISKHKDSNEFEVEWVKKQLWEILMTAMKFDRREYI